LLVAFGGTIANVGVHGAKADLRVERRDYIAFDRGRLAYLNWAEALNCAYCAYANGVIVYVREI
jgi:hypothetical protein